VWDAGWWAPGPVWIGAENIAPTGIEYLDHPPHSKSPYHLRFFHLNKICFVFLYFQTEYDIDLKESGAVLADTTEMS
jgi:hypothetical protein